MAAEQGAMGMRKMRKAYYIDRSYASGPYRKPAWERMPGIYTSKILATKQIAKYKRMGKYQKDRSEFYIDFDWVPLKSNAPRGAVRIYDNILSIEAEKGNDSLWPGELFRHDFKAKKGKAAIYGLPDGSILIKGNKRLWKRFNYPERRR